MLDLDSARRVVLREVDDFVSCLGALSDADWQRPVRRVDWTIHDMARHVAWGEAVQADGLRNMIADRIDEPRALYPADDGTRQQTFDALQAARDSMAAALAELRPEYLERPCRIPFGTFPTAVVTQVCVIEAGTHANDLAWALGDERPLPAEVVEATGAILGPVLVYLADGRGWDFPVKPTKPDLAISYALTGAPIELCLTYQSDEWQANGVSDAATCAISGTGSALALFALGRIPATHPSLRIDGDRALAGQFKAFFPGP